jgi:hypothetical protein
MESPRPCSSSSAAAPLSLVWVTVGFKNGFLAYYGLPK